MMTAEAIRPFLTLAGLHPDRDAEEWNHWQRELPRLFDCGLSLRLWAETRRADATSFRAADYGLPLPEPAPLRLALVWSA
jgi:hypothetical protein